MDALFASYAWADNITAASGLSRWIGFLSIGAMLILPLVVFGCTRQSQQAAALQQITKTYKEGH